MVRFLDSAVSTYTHNHTNPCTDEIHLLCEKNKPTFFTLHNTVAKFLERNARSVVSLADIFSFMNLQQRRWRVAV